MSWNSELDLAKSTAQKAGKYLMEKHLTIVRSKDISWRDIKLKADRESENLIIKNLSNSTVYPILAEESGEHNLITENQPFWIIDPLDGSLNYCRGIPLYCISIALWYKQEPILGVVYDVSTRDLFSGLVGKGAWCNDESVYVSGITSAKNAILATGFPVNRDFSSESLQRFLSAINTFKKIRLLGSAALSLAYVAAGRIDAYFEEGIMLWDVAAGIALVKAAGGWTNVRLSIQHKWARDVLCASRRNTFPVQYITSQ